jgi:5-methyltetrahydrofolate--homocysteine methyltransferase
MTDLDKSWLAVKVANENTNCKVFFTMASEKTVDGEFRSMMGVSPTKMVNTIVSVDEELNGATPKHSAKVCVEIDEK